MKKISLLSFTLLMLFSGCTDEDDNRDINYELLLGEWKPIEMRINAMQVVPWDTSCGDDFLLFANDSVGQYNLHFNACQKQVSESFSYKMELMHLFIMNEGTDSVYKRQIVKLTANELVLKDTDFWTDNYIKYKK
ncbi:lipocalin family protein [Flavobacterium agricola]|uniref:Lipocalin family protein n=1 Tax=Flavobacterium agricola TaxID=2870839 RepID=A0ABY6LZ44_9FLAO|nr:lipocalin family protein [Flavobacterium agricola]UYW00822.1 lipocalin family protein [Flavobacterium agricola]